MSVCELLLLCIFCVCSLLHNSTPTLSLSAYDCGGLSFWWVCEFSDFHNSHLGTKPVTTRSLPWLLGGAQCGPRHHGRGRLTENDFLRRSSECDGTLGEGRVEGRGGSRSAALLPPLLRPSRAVPCRPVPAGPDPARPPPRASFAALAAAHGARKMEDYGRFLALLASALLVGFVSVILSLVWVFHYREGLSWDGSLGEFNWHPVLIITGFVFIQGIAIIVYRLPWTWKCSKLLMKFIHAGLNTIAMILAIVSMVAVFEFHNAKNIPNMYSLHSWIGLTAVIFYSLQLFLGFAVFLLPFAPVHLRVALMPIHVYSGLTIFATVIATALMGITEKLIFALKSPAYSASPPEATLVNCLGLLLVIFGSLILWMASRPHWKRPPAENAKILRPTEATPDGTEVESTLTKRSNADKSDLRSNTEAARKQNIKFDEAGQRSTM